MTYRKIISFGGGSFVVSLPKKWIEKNGLKKGELVGIEDEGNCLKIQPGILKQTNESSEIKIHFNGNIKKLKSEILYAYINNFNPIVIVGKGVHSKLDKVNNIIRDFMYLDIIDQTQDDKIIIHTSVNLFDISIYDTIRRMDRIVMSMSEDVKNYLAGKNDKVEDSLENKEENLNKLCNLIFKTLKLSFNPSDRTILKLEINDILYYWELVIFIEKVADILKRIPRYIKPKIPEKLITLFDKVMLQYSDSMKANFTKDYDLAVGVFLKKRELYDEGDDLVKNSSFEHIKFAEKLGNINNFAGNLSKVMLRLNRVDLGNK